MSKSVCVCIYINRCVPVYLFILLYLYYSSVLYNYVEVAHFTWYFLLMPTNNSWEITGLLCYKRWVNFHSFLP